MKAQSLLILLGLLNFSTSLKSSPNPYTLSQINVTDTSITALATYHLGLSSANETIITHLLLNITFDNSQRLRIRLTDNSLTRWEVPNDLPPYTIQSTSLLYSVKLTESPMGILVTRTSDSSPIFFLDPTLYFSFDDQDLLFTNSLPYPILVMGLGERICPFLIPTGSYTMWSRDRASPIDDGQSMTGNMYSVHPFYLAVNENTGEAFGSLFYNSNAMSVTVGTNSVTFRSTGGIIDLWLFLGPKPEDVIFQYHQLIGTPALVPYWSLGWHQSRYGYTYVQNLTDVLNNYTYYNIPLDAIWNDIDYMNLYENFVFNQSSYPTPAMTKFLTQLNSANKHYIPIVDAGVRQDTSYYSYNAGLSQGVYIQSPYNKTVPPTPTVGVVWPGNCTFVDWLHPNATNYWVSQLQGFIRGTPFSGIWIDMNENSNFISGELGHPPSIITNETMPWTPGEDLNVRSIDVAAVHYGGVIEYNFHSLNGYYEGKATNAFYSNSNSRPFILTRSSFPGYGRYGFKWLGDNFSQWSFLQESITGIFNFGMFGIPMIGADICGFFGNTNEELCTRWTQLGALYPFSRNHNFLESIPQEPYALGPTLLHSSNLAIRNKYMLYLYFYTNMIQLSQNGGMFFKPAYFEYPQEISLLYNATTSFMLGSALIVHPCLWQGVSGTTSYFPNDNWYNLYTGEYVFLDFDNSAYLDMPLNDTINIHVTQGHIIPLVDSYMSALSSRDTRYSNISLLIVQSGVADAIGTVIFDDGSSGNTLVAKSYTQVSYEFYSFNSTFDVFTITVESSGYVRVAGEWPYISTLIFYGCTAAPENVYLFNGKVTVMLPVTVYWNAAEAVCKIWLKGFVQPDAAATIYIDYFI